MPESVSLGVVYTGAELRLTDFNKQWDTLVGKLEDLGKTWDRVKFSPKNLLAGMGEAEKGVSGLNKAISGTLSQVEKLNKLAFSAGGILRGTDQATRALEAVGKVSQESARLVLDLSAKTTEAGGSLRSMGNAAAAADGKLGALAGTSAAAAAGVEDIGKAGLDTSAGLEMLADGAKVAKTSVSALGRAAGLTVPKLDSLSLAKFDPAGIVAGADEGIGALGRLRLAAQGVKDSLQLSPALTGAGRIGGAGQALTAAEGAGAFKGGLKAGGSAALDLGGAGAAITTLLAAVSGKMAASFDNAVQGVKGNTTMTPEDVAALKTQTLRLMKTGTDQQELLDSYKHIVNLGFHGEGARQIQEVSNRFGIATHSPVGETGDVIARYLNEFHLGPEAASRMANTVHYGAANSNADIKEIERNTTRSTGLAAGYIGAKGLPDVLAAIGALVKNMTTPKADTQVSGMIQQIASPSPKAQKRAEALGISADFNAVGLRRENLSGVVEKVKAAIAKLPEIERAPALKDLFNNKQGGIGATFLTGTRSNDYHKILNDPKNGTKAAFEGKTDPVGPLYKEQMDQPAQKVAALKGKIAANAVSIGESFNKIFITSLPMITKFTDSLAGLLKAVTKLPVPVQEAILAFGGFKLLTAFLPMLGGIGLVSEKTGLLVGNFAKMLLGLGPAAAEGGAGVAGAGAVLSGPFALGVLTAVAAAAALALAWKSDFGHIREVTAKVGAEVVGFVNSQFGYVKKWFTQNMPLIRETVKTALTFIEQFWHSHGSRIMAIIRPLWSLIKTVFSAALHIIGAVVKLGMDIITGHWGAAAKDVGVIVTNLWAVVRSLFENGVKIVGNALALVVDVVLDAGKRLFEAALNAGQQVINGLVGGIKSGAGKVAAAAKGLAASIPSTVTGMLQIMSPSRVMHEIGRHTAQGLADGITAGKSGVTTAMRGVVEAALKETNSKKAALLIDHQARALRAGGMGASDVADFRESAKAALSERGKSGRGTGKLDSERHAAGEFAATVGESPELKELHRLNETRAKGLISAAAYVGALGRIQGNQHKKSEAEAARHQAVMNKYKKAAQAAAENLQQMKDSLAALTGSPETPTLDKQEAAAKRQYRENVQKQGGTLVGDQIADGPYRPDQEKAFAVAGQLRDRHLAGIQRQRDAATEDVQAGIDGMNDKAAQDKHPYDFLRDQAQKKYGAGGTELKAGADPVKTAEALRLALKGIQDEEGKDAKETEDRKQQYLLSTQAITLSQYQAYLKTRLGDYQDYSSEWVQLSQGINDIDLQLWKQQEDALKQKFDAGIIDLKEYIAGVQALEATLPKTASPTEKAGIDDQIAHLDGKEKKQTDKEMVGGDDFWKSVAGDAADNGSKVLTALLHPKDKKQIFKSMWSDLMGSLEGGATSQFSKVLKNLITGQGGGFNLGSLFGGLFGGKKSSAASGTAATVPGSAAAGGGGLMAGGLGALTSLLPGLGGFGGALGGLLGGGGMGGFGGMLGAGAAGSLNPQGINGTVSGFGGMLGGVLGHGGLLGGVLGHGGLLGGVLGHGGLLGGVLGHGGLAGLLGHGAMSALPWVGGGLLLASLFKKPLGKLFKHFHLAKGAWSVPGHGSGDTVPAMLSPKEMVLPVSGAEKVRQALSGRGDHPAAMATRGGGIQIHVTHNGDNHSVADVDRMHENWAYNIRQQLPVTTPGI